MSIGWGSCAAFIYLFCHQGASRGRDNGDAHISVLTKVMLKSMVQYNELVLKMCLSTLSRSTASS